MKITITQATVSDLAAIQSIYAHYVETSTVTLEEVAPSLEEITARWNYSAEKNAPYLVAKIGEEVVGYAYATTYRTRSAYRFTLEESVYVHKDHHGKRIGFSLLEALIAECRARGFKQLLAIVGDAQNHASIALHQKLGFIEAGRLKNVGFKFDRWIDSALLQREL